MRRSRVLVSIAGLSFFAACADGTADGGDAATDATAALDVPHIEVSVDDARDDARDDATIDSMPDAPPDAHSDAASDALAADVTDAVAESGDVSTIDAALDAAPDAPPSESSFDATSDDALADSADASAEGSADGGPDAFVDATVDAPAADGALDALDADDAFVPDAAADALADIADATVLAYRHTIAIDGLNDFAAAEAFSTTTVGFTAYVSWDATNLYLAYDAADVSAGNPKHWLFAYLDLDPGVGTGALSSVAYNSQSSTFTAGFGAEYYLRWKASDDFSTLEVHGATGWTTATAAVSRKKKGSFVEFELPLAALGITTPTQLGVLTYWINETAFVESTFGGLFAGSFADGYSSASASKAIGAYLLADFATAAAPNDSTRKRP